MTSTEIVVPNLRQGVPYFFRVAAANARGYGPALVAIPVSLAPSVNPPAEPRSVFLGSDSGSSIDVSFMPPAIDGGLPVEKYLVEFSPVEITPNVQEVRINSAPQQERQVVSTAADQVPEVQVIQTTGTAGGLSDAIEVQAVECDATGGVFRLSFRGHQT